MMAFKLLLTKWRTAAQMTANLITGLFEFDWLWWKVEIISNAED